MKAVSASESRVAWRGTARKVYWKFRSILGPYFCPVCDQRVAAFTPFGDGYTTQWAHWGFDHTVTDFETLNSEQYGCPFCGSSDRDRLCALFIRKCIPTSRRTLRLIDFAPSAALASMLKKLPLVSYRSADLYMDGVDDKVDIMDLAVYPSGSVDCFICSHVLEHVQDDRRALSELWRVLGQEGWGLLLVPISTRLTETRESSSSQTTVGDRWKYFGQNDHLRLYSKTAFLKRLTEVGFVVEQIGAAQLGENDFRRSGITLSSILYVVKKPRLSES